MEQFGEPFITDMAKAQRKRWLERIAKMEEDKMGIDQKNIRRK